MPPMGTSTSRSAVSEIGADWEPVVATSKGTTLDVAVIGAGVAGLGAAWHLTKSSSPEDVRVTVFEPSDVAGGHAHTIDVEVDGGSNTVPVDTGFMVFNHQNYPNLVGLFKELGVEEESTDMSFAVSLDDGAFEWGSASVAALLARRTNALRPSFWRMLADMVRFNREAPALLQLDDEDPRKAMTVGEYLRRNNYSAAFARYYLVPMAAALWSSSGAEVMGFSALTMISFFHNHSMLQVFNRPQWKTPAGRSKTYVARIVDVLGASLELSNGVTAVAQDEDGRWAVTDTKGVTRSFHQVVFACHADTALQLLGASASDAERDALGAFAFARNTTYVHSDAALMPRRRAAWSAWNYMGDSADATARGGGGAKPVYVTYWLNKLQNLDCQDGVFVSLNPSAPPDPAKTHRVIETMHPQFTPEGERSQRKVAALNGRRGLWFCGAWMGYGFHEDGLRSGLEVSSAITGKPVPWATDKQLVVPQPCLPRAETLGSSGTGWAYRATTAIAFRSIRAFLSRTIRVGRLVITCPDGQQLVFGEVLPRKSKVIHLRVFDWWFFVRVALEYDLGLARAYMAGEWAVADDTRYADGLRALFLLFIDNRDAEGAALSVSRLLTSWGGYMLNFVRYRLSMDNSLSGSRSNIHAHYDLSNDLFTTFLDAETLMYSSAIYDAALVPVPAARRELARPPPAADAAGAAARMEAVVAAAAAAGAAPEEYELVFRGTLEEAQIRKIDTLLARVRVQRHHTLLDIGFGWGGVAIRAAQTIGCRVWGITLSTEQKALAEARVRERGLEHLITFELVDYRVFARQHRGEFDRIISCEMIEAVGHNYLPSYFAAVEALLAPGGVFVMEAIATPESRYKEYLRSTDFINTIIFPGSCCPSLTALMDAMASHSRLSLEGYENIGVHYAETLREWRCRFTDALPALRARGFDAVFARCWHYYFAYCEAGFASQTEGCLILTFSRPGNAALLVDAETHRVVAKNATNADAAAAAAAARRGSVGGARRSSSVGL